MNVAGLVHPVKGASYGLVYCYRTTTRSSYSGHSVSGLKHTSALLHLQQIKNPDYSSVERYV